MTRRRMLRHNVIEGLGRRCRRRAGGAAAPVRWRDVSPVAWALEQLCDSATDHLEPPQQTWLYRECSDDLDMKQALFALLVIASATPSALAQKEIPKASGHDQCPLGYLNTLGTTCVSPIYYEVAPTNGKACKSGWMNIGAGYCKKKTLGIF